MTLREFEIEVLNQMLKLEFSQTQVNSILNSSVIGLEHAGSGYFIEITDQALPLERKVISEPILMGRGKDFQVGFVLFVENNKLTFECHSTGIENPPNTIREEDIEIIVVNNDALKLYQVYNVLNFSDVHLVEFVTKMDLNDFDISQITQAIPSQERLNGQSAYD